MRPTTTLAITLALATTAGAARAGDEPSADRVLVNDKAHLSLGAGFSAPLGLVAGLDLLVGQGADVRDSGERVKGVAGVALGLQAGRGGGKLSLGVGAHANIHSDDFKGMAAVALRASLARTWSDRTGASRGTYLGPELDLAVRHVNATLGVLNRVSGRGRHVVFAWGLGLRL